MRAPGRPNAGAGVIVAAVSVAVSFLTVGVPGVGAAHSGPASAPASGAAQWAYGGLGTRSWTGVGATYHYDASVTVGFVVVLHEVAGPSGTFTLYANRTMGVLLSVKYCVPSCAHPTVSATVDYHAWEVDRAMINLTTDGYVTLDGTPTPALALNSSSMSIVVGIRESTRVYASGTLIRGHNASVDVDANTTTTFVPPLGLVPLKLSPDTTWNSTSAFVRTGAVNWSVRVVLVNGSVPINDSGAIPLADTGAVSVNGSYGGRVVRLAGANYDVLTMNVTGPFSVREGFLFIPSASDIFGNTSPSWLTAASTSGSSSFSQESLDVASPLAGGSHLGFYGSEIVWSSGTANPATVVTTAGGAAPAVVPEAGSANATTVQGGPESLAQATTDQNCLASGLGCPGVAGPHGLLAELLVVGGAVGAVVIAVALVAERRRLPPTPYPNAALYPPGPAAPTTPPGPRPAPPAPAEDDPLSHLW